MISVTVGTTAMTVDKASETKYSVEETARLIGVSPITVWRKVKRGRLDCYRLCGGNILRIGKSHIEKYLSASEQADSN